MPDETTPEPCMPLPNFLLKILPLGEKPEKRPMFSDRDRENIAWFWNRYLKSRTPWLFLVLGLIALQGVVYQQFLVLTEDGLRVIFESGAMSESYCQKWCPRGFHAAA
jgi:ATP-binding cassette subfamily B protein/subfamily B ATP-binding cassette protein MsbA